ncbi:MAG: tagaturonate reductase [Kiritimatiellae bacterium]|nr:tagaturonate reductase [Kiritimatiellia bacterium]
MVILQFGEGNFLRCFADRMIEGMNRNAGLAATVQIVQPRERESEAARLLNARGGRFHIALRGMEGGRPVERIEEVRCVRGVLNPQRDWAAVEAVARDPALRIVLSNTTEAGIVYRPDADTFPAKVARLLKARHDAGLPGVRFLPCELIERNGETLRDCVLRYVADPALCDWIGHACTFHNTLVDQIVSGRPDAESAERFAHLLGERDETLVCGEPFHFWAIENGEELEREFPLQTAGFNVIYPADLTPYRTRKVRFLNGAHTATALAGHLAGFTFVADLVNDPAFGARLRHLLFEEILPTVPLPEDEKRAYAESVLERFANPFAHHRLLSIALNSVSKWRVRVLPTLLDYLETFGRLPEYLTDSMAALIRFYRSGIAEDDPGVLAFFKTDPSVAAILAREDFWGMDLNTLPGMTGKVNAACG